MIGNELEKILKEEDKIRTRMKSFFLVLQRLKDEMSDEQREMVEKLKEKRKEAIENVEELLKRAEENFISSGCQVFHAKNGKEALNYIFSEIEDEEMVVKAKSNVLREIKLDEKAREKGIEVIPTDVGDRIVEILNEDLTHPTGPAAHLSAEHIASRLSEVFNTKIPPTPEAIANFIRDDTMKYIMKAKVGISGANAFASEGIISLVHSEGNISLVTRIPEKHIAVLGIDRIVRSAEDTVTFAKVQSLYALGKPITAYVDLISGPSKTGDIEKKIVKGMYGPREMHVIFLDNGRKKLMKRFPELARCIGCGACVLVCPAANVAASLFGHSGHRSARGIAYSYFIEGLESAISRGLFLCTTCHSCSEICPMGIELPKIMKEIRREAVSNNLRIDAHERVVKLILEEGSPYPKKS
jgi:L-lactate dehydrogenase complex protein LldG